MGVSFGKIYHVVDEYCDRIAWVTIFFGFIVFLIYFIILFFGNHIFSSMQIDIDKSASIATFISGSVGVLWALSGVLLFYSALKIQQKSLREMKNTNVTQSKLLKEQQKLINIQKKELEESKKLLRRQIFESTFFHIIDRICIAEQERITKGMATLSPAKRIISDMKSMLNNTTQKNGDMSKNETYSGYRSTIDFVHIGLQMIMDTNWGEEVKEGTGISRLSEVIKNLTRPFSEFMKSFSGTPKEIIRDKKAYGAVLASSLSVEGRVVLFYYMNKCDTQFLNLALTLGLFNKIPKSSFVDKASPEIICENITIENGLTMVQD